MTTSAGPGGLVLLLDDVRRLAGTAAADVLGHLPDTGDHVTGRAVDDFVEQAADALRALETVLADTIRTARATGDEVTSSESLDTPRPSRADPSSARPGWLR